MDPEIESRATLDDVRAALRMTRKEWDRRLGAIQADRRRQSRALDPNLDDQAIQRENDEALDALDVRGREELAQIDAALARIDAGTYGRCARCGNAITTQRLRAQPTARECVSCAVSAAS